MEVCVKRFLKVLIGAIGDVFLTLILAMCLSLLMRSIGIVEEDTTAIILNFSCVIILVTLIKLEIK